MSLIEDRGQTNHALTLTFSFNPQRATVVTHTHAKDQGQRSVGSKDRWTEAIALPPMLMQSVISVKAIIWFACCI